MIASNIRAARSPRAPQLAGKTGSVSERTCAVCKNPGVGREMIRLVATPEGEVIFDAKRKAPGRGYNLCNDSECLSEGLKKKRIARGFKLTNPVIDVEAIKGSIRANCLTKVAGYFNIARISGKLIEGRTAIDAAIEARKVFLIICAGDLASETRDSFLRKAETAGVDSAVFGEAQLLSGSGGHKRLRAVFAIVDKRLADAIKKTISFFDDLNGN